MKVHHEKQPFKVEGAISAAVQVYLAFAVATNVEFFSEHSSRSSCIAGEKLKLYQEQGARADLILKAPYFNFNLEFVSCECEKSTFILLCLPSQRLPEVSVALTIL